MPICRSPARRAYRDADSRRQRKLDRLDGLAHDNVDDRIGGRRGCVYACAEIRDGRTMSFDCALCAPRREPAGQEHVLNHREVRDQIELLEDEADVLDAKPVAPAQRRKLGAEDTDAPFLRGQDSGEQGKQRALAAAARTEEEYALARLDLKAFDGKAGRLAEGQRKTSESTSISGPWAIFEVSL